MQEMNMMLQKEQRFTRFVATTDIKILLGISQKVLERGGDPKYLIWFIKK
jgi:hypothetical protein